MSSQWRRIADNSNGRATVAELEAAAHRLEASQILYAADRMSRAAYELIVAYLSAFEAAFDPLGRSLHHRPRAGYVVLKSRHRVGPRLGLDETRAGVVLRRVYDDKMVRADIEGGQIVCDVEEMQRGWTEWLGREWTFRKGELDDLLRSLRRMGIVKLMPDDDQRFVIRPGIEDVMGEDVLHQLAVYGLQDEAAPAVSQEDAE